MIALLTASLGSIDKPIAHCPQSMPYKQFIFTDDNFPLRSKAMTTRLQAKIPKCFGWQLASGYEYYMWIDGNIRMSDKDTLKFFYDNCQDNDIVVLRHPRRPNIRQEVRYVRKGLREQSKYLVVRYDGEWLKEQYRLVKNDLSYTDDLLVNGGVFFYRNCPEIQSMLKEWWYYQTRYIVQDQLNFPYVLKKSGVRIKILEEDINHSKWLNLSRHLTNEK